MADAEEAVVINPLKTLPALGVGLGFRQPHWSELFLHRPEVDFLEITADHFFDAPPERNEQLKLLAETFTLIPHGLDLSLGSADGLDASYLEKFTSLVNRLNPPWWSEHLSFTRANGRRIGHLTPLPFTKEAVETVARNVATTRLHTQVPLILENITYTLNLPGAEMSECDFLRAVLDESGCGLLLDVTNLYINARNHGFDPRRWLDAAPMDRVVQIHYVGVTENDGNLIDSHAEAVGPDIWALLEEVLTRAPVRGAILERDDNIPPLQDLLPELAQARALGQKHQRWD